VFSILCVGGRGAKNKIIEVILQNGGEGEQK
jgi:hypothetical protein